MSSSARRLPRRCSRKLSPTTSVHQRCDVHLLSRFASRITYAASMLVLLARLQPGPVAPDLVQVVGRLQAALAKLGHGLGRADLGEPPCDPVRNNVEVAVYLEAVVVGAPGLPSDVERQVLHH